MSTDTDDWVAAQPAPVDAVLPSSALEELDRNLRAICTEQVEQAVARQQELQPGEPVTAQDVVLLQLRILREAAQMLERMQGLVCNQGAARGMSNTVMGEPLGIGREGVRGLRQRTAERSAT